MYTKNLVTSTTPIRSTKLSITLTAITACTAGESPAGSLVLDRLKRGVDFDPIEECDEVGGIERELDEVGRIEEELERECGGVDVKELEGECGGVDVKEGVLAAHL